LINSIQKRIMQPIKTTIMRSFQFAICFLFLSLTANTLYSQEFFEELTAKEWEGSGTLMGAEANFEMQWAWVLDQQFLRLEFQNSRGSSTFKGHGYYRIEGGTTVSGMWFDARGFFFPLSGTLNENVLTINWGTPETEQGRTVYTLISSENIKVTDYILKDGEYLQFGEAQYQ